MAERVRISMVRSGGLAGQTVRGSLDSEALPPEEAREVTALVDALVDSPTLPGLHGGLGGAVRDGFRYELSVQRGEQTWQLSLADSTVGPDLRPLLTRLVQEGRRGG